MESVGSGSGLLDLTREGDDTSLGADLLEDVYSGEEGGAAESETQAASGLFETTTAHSDVSAGMAGAGAPMLMVAAEPFDGLWSGIAGGMAVGIIVVVGLALMATVLGIVGVPDNAVVGLFTKINANPMIWMGMAAAIIAVPTVIGALVGRKA
jgi:hypothetical protein